MLAVSGVWLTFTYRPNAAQAWPGVSDPSPMQWPRMIHLLPTWLIVPASAGLVVASAAVKRAAAPAVGLLMLVIALAYTGFLIAWEQLALWAVSSAGFPDGMWAAAFERQRQVRPHRGHRDLPGHAAAVVHRPWRRAGRHL